MFCINSHSNTTNCHIVVASGVGLAALTLIVLSIIGLTASSSGPFDRIVQWGATTHEIILGTSAGVLGFDLIWIIMICKKTERQVPLPPINIQEGNFAANIEELNDKSLNKQVSGVYTLSNETGIETTIKAIENLNDQDLSLKMRCHIGVGAFHNFDIMATRRSDYGILIDFNPENRAFINRALELIQETNNPSEFVEKIVHYMELDAKKYNHYKGYDSPIQRMYAELTRPSSWLWGEDTTGKFEFIKNLAINRKIVAITQDFCSIELFQRLTPMLGALNCSIDTLYLSNLYAFIPEDIFNKVFDYLAQFEPIIIHCTPPDTCSCRQGCQCPKQQHIGNQWEKIGKEKGGITLKTRV